MITNSLSKIAPAFLAIALLTSAHAAKPTLAEVTKATELAVSKAPEKAAEIVTEKVTETPEYACPIIKAAIQAGNIAREIQPEIVAAALKAAPEKAPEIKACLPNELSDGAAGKGGAAGKSGATGKAPAHGKGPVTLPDEDSDLLVEEPYPGPGSQYDGFYGVIGTYLSIPGGGTVIGNGEKPIVVVVEGRPKPRKKPKPPVSNPGTFSIPNQDN